MEDFLKTHWNQPTAVEEKVLFAEQLLQGVASATQDLLTIANYEDSIQAGMKTLGKATQVDRIYIFRHHLHLETQQPLTSQVWEWVNQGVTPQIDNPDLQSLPLAELFPRWYQEFTHGRSISGLVEAFPDKEREILASQEILSIVVVPILIKSSYWGFMGFDDCHYGHNWSKSEVAVLKSVANSFGGAFKRHQVENNLIQKNQELEQQKIELQKAKIEAERANETKNVFLAKVSHELRTPMNGILGYAQILERSKTLHPKEQRGVNVIHQCANHLLMLINDLLDISKIEAKKLELVAENVSLQALMDEVIAVCQVRADSKKIDLISILSSDVPQLVLTDAKRLKQVLLNLIYNAIKFTEQGQVKLDVSICPNPHEYSSLDEQDYCTLRFSVNDSGIGISSDNIKMLFGAFAQIEDQNSPSDGVGLGLSISQEIVQVMGSSIEVKSELNVGSTFFFDLDLPIVPMPNFSESGQISMLLERDRNESTQSDQSDPSTEKSEAIIPPSSAILSDLKLLAQSGRLKKIIEAAQHLESSNAEFSAFASVIIQLAKGFKTEEIESYLDRFLDGSDP